MRAESLSIDTASRIAPAVAKRLNRERKTREVAVPWWAFKLPSFAEVLSEHTEAAGRPLEATIAYTFPGVQVSIFVTPEDHAAILRVSRRSQLRALWSREIDPAYMDSL